MTNPMYLGELDDTPAFIHDETKVMHTVNFSNHFRFVFVVFNIYFPFLF